LNTPLLTLAAPGRIANDRKISKELDLPDFPALHFSVIEPLAQKKTASTPNDRLKIMQNTRGVCGPRAHSH
jgi:hypothetical protein